ncbi:hypothetical protein [Dokdonella sp.]|uniref:hypothetical protein n=1 Tax=Dokdonella sp. TaxID=2291710 RepID=UPI0031C866AD|nr:hypothetical protein [Xanthomonadales bacterium]
MRIMFSAWIAIGCLASGWASAWEDYPGFLSPGYAGIEVGDFDGDGSREAVVTGYTGYSWLEMETMLAVLAPGGPGQPLEFQHITRWPTQFKGTLVAAPPDGAADRMAVISGEGATSQILILGGVPVQVLRIVQAPYVSALSGIADVDADGLMDIVALTTINGGWTRYPVVLDFADGAVKWTSAAAATDVAFGQLDGDAALELVTAATPGQVVDGVTHAVEWTYAGGFGERVLVGRFGTGPAIGFVSISRWSGLAQVFQSAPYSPVSEFDVDEVATARIVRLADDGPDRIAIGNGQWGSVTVRDALSGQALITLPNPEHGVSAMAVGDVDGDGHFEMLWGSGLTSSGADVLFAVDLTTLSEDFRQGDEQGPYSALARGDLDGNGSDRVAYLTVSANSGYSGSVLRILDADTGQRLRERINVLDSWGGVPPVLAVGQFDADPQEEILVAGGYLYDGNVALLDGVTLEDQWRVDRNLPAFNGYSVHALALADVNLDGVPDAVVATGAAKLVVLDGRNGNLLWQSVTISGSPYPALVALPVLANRAPLIALSKGQGLYLFDLETHLLVDSISTKADIAALRQWGTEADCRLAALGADAVIGVYSCNSLDLLNEQIAPPDTAFLYPLDADGTRYLVAAGSKFYRIDADGNATAISRDLGRLLNAGNSGIVTPGPNNAYFDVIAGSTYMVTRTRIGEDIIFVGNFD